MKNKKWLILSFVYLISVVLWVLEAGDPFYYMTRPAPAGQSLYLLSKFMGFIAFAGLTFQVVAGLMQFKSQAQVHKMNGQIVFLLLVSHIVLFIAATTLRAGHLTTHLLIPNFSTWYQSMVSLGVLGFYGVVIGLAVRMLKVLRQNTSLSTQIHRINIVAYIAILCHSFTVGSETRYLSFTVLYAGLAMLLLGVLYKRFVWAGQEATAL